MLKSVRWNYVVVLATVAVALRFAADWTWNSITGAMAAMVVAYYVLVALIDERVARLTPALHPRSGSDPPPPRVPDPRIWSLEFRWAVPFIEGLVTTRGFPCSRELIESSPQSVVKKIKIEEFATSIRLHRWTVPAGGPPTADYTWTDIPVRSTSGDELRRDDLMRSQVWMFEFTKFSDPLGMCRMALSTHWRRVARDARPSLYLVFWIDWWKAEDAFGKSGAVQPDDVIFETPFDHEILDASTPTVQSDGVNLWKSERGQGAAWDWSWYVTLH